MLGPCAEKIEPGPGIQPDPFGIAAILLQMLIRVQTIELFQLTLNPEQFKKSIHY